MKSLSNWLEENMPEQTKKLIDTKESVLDEKAERSEEYLAAVIDFMFAVRNVSSAMNAAWSPVYEPTNEVERAQYEVILIRRNVWKNLLSVNSA